jgi:protein-S-isoprenylcysteine O-methyltransferase Ste14
VVLPLVFRPGAAEVAFSVAVRIRAEERQLTQALGAEYERFAAGRKRLVPGAW